MKNWNKIGIADFLRNNPGMTFAALSSKQAMLEGTYHLSAYHPAGGNVDKDYNLRIEIPVSFPREVPIVREINYLIPRDNNHHINRGTDSLCLGSRIKILQKIYENPTISGFVEKCVVPLLYAAVLDDFVFGELEHGYRGILEDYKEIFSVSTSTQVLGILFCLSRKKRFANKQLCPCGCGHRLGKCKIHNTINNIRRLSFRNSFKIEYDNILKEKRYEVLNKKFRTP
jgi:hypothetical protein